MEYTMAPMFDAERGSGDNTVLQLEQQQEHKAAAATLRDTTAAIALLPDPMDQSVRAIQETEKLLLQAQKALESTRLITQKAAAKNQSSDRSGEGDYAPLEDLSKGERSNPMVVGCYSICLRLEKSYGGDYASCADSAWKVGNPKAFAGNPFLANDVFISALSCLI